MHPTLAPAVAPALARLEDFVPDKPVAGTLPDPEPIPVPPGAIAGVVVAPLQPRRDGRGRLVVLLSESDGTTGSIIEPMVHAYRVFAAPGSVRAWVYHSLQTDRLTFTEGAFRVALVDLRPASPTYGATQVIDAGAANPARVEIPPFVVHGVKNLGETETSFVNLPTRAYDPARPDKARLPYGHPGIPYRFD